MSEFISNELLIVSIVGLMMLYGLKVLSKDYRSLVYFFTIALVAVNIYVPISSHSNAKEKLASFNKGSAFVCYSDGNRYKVSSKDSWKEDKYYFVKDSLMIRADHCKEVIQ